MSQTLWTTASVDNSTCNDHFIESYSDVDSAALQFCDSSLSELKLSSQLSFESKGKDDSGQDEEICFGMVYSNSLNLMYIL